MEKIERRRVRPEQCQIAKIFDRVDDLFHTNSQILKVGVSRITAVFCHPDSYEMWPIRQLHPAFLVACEVRELFP
jgi:hypothetical protein